MYMYIPPVSVPDGSNTSPAKATERVNIFLLKVTYQITCTRHMELLKII